MMTISQRTALATLLTDRGFITQVAADGFEALERLSTFNPDVVVSDLVMPRMDGFELLRQLKESRRSHSGDCAHCIRKH